MILDEVADKRNTLGERQEATYSRRTWDIGGMKAKQNTVNHDPAAKARREICNECRRTVGALTGKNDRLSHNLGI